VCLVSLLSVCADSYFACSRTQVLAARRSRRCGSARQSPRMCGERRMFRALCACACVSVRVCERISPAVMFAVMPLLMRTRLHWRGLRK
jgi:hypothetical protein